MLLMKANWANWRRTDVFWGGHRGEPGKLSPLGELSSSPSRGFFS